MDISNNNKFSLKESIINNIWTIVLSLVIGIATYFITDGVYNLNTSLNARIDRLELRMDNRIDDISYKVDNLSVRMFNLEKEFALHNKGHQ